MDNYTGYHERATTRANAVTPDEPGTSQGMRFMLGAPLRTLDRPVEALGAIEEAPPNTEINLCLSGGGIRAALFHLGVLYYLDTVGRLKDVRRISSVSGGSILAAHFALRRSQYLQGFTKSDDKSALSAFEFAEFARSDLRGRVFRRWIAAVLFAPGLISAAVASVWRWWPQVIAPNLCCWGMGFTIAGLMGYVFRRKLARLAERCSRIGLLDWGYDRFLSRHRDKSSVTLSNLPNASDLDLEILGTSFTTGVPVSFAQHGITIHSVPPLTRRNLTYPVSRAVTASTAFPAAFPPVFLSKVDDLLLDAGNPATSDHYVGDGGVYDNLGICNMVSRLEAAPTADKSFLIISDAGLPFQGDPPVKELGYGWLTRRALRSTDIQMNRLAILDNGDAQTRLTSTRPDVVVLPCNISEEVPGSDVSQLEVKIRKIRTDLNAFSAVEMHVLVRHGFNVANQKCQQHLGVAQETMDRWSPLLTRERRNLQLDDAQNPQRAISKLSEGLKNSDHVPIGLIDWMDWRGVFAFLLAFTPWLMLWFIVWFRLSLPDSLPRENQLTESHMAFTDWRDPVRYLYKQKPGTLCYFEIPIKDWYRGRMIKISYEKEDNARSVIEVHAFRIAAGGAIYELPVALRDEGQGADVTAPNCNRGDFLAVFVIVAKPSEDLFKPFQVR